MGILLVYDVTDESSFNSNFFFFPIFQFMFGFSFAFSLVFLVEIFFSFVIEPKDDVHFIILLVFFWVLFVKWKEREMELVTLSIISWVANQKYNFEHIFILFWFFWRVLRRPHEQITIKNSPSMIFSPCTFPLY